MRPPTIEPRSTEQPTIEVTYSELAAFLECGMAFRLQNLIGFKPRLAPELGYGKAVHPHPHGVRAGPEPVVVGLPYEALVRCERCDQGERQPVTRAKLAERDGKVAVVLDVPMQECPACAERWLEWNVARRLDELLNSMLAGDVEVVTKHFDRTDSPTEFNATQSDETTEHASVRPEAKRKGKSRLPVLLHQLAAVPCRAG